jgi:hypothetical protein
VQNRLIYHLATFLKLSIFLYFAYPVYEVSYDSAGMYRFKSIA